MAESAIGAGAQALIEAFHTPESKLLLNDATQKFILNVMSEFATTVNKNLNDALREFEAVKQEFEDDIELEQLLKVDDVSFPTPKKRRLPASSTRGALDAESTPASAAAPSTKKKRVNGVNYVNSFQRFMQEHLPYVQKAMPNKLVVDHFNTVAEYWMYYSASESNKLEPVSIEEYLQYNSCAMGMQS